MKHLKIFALGLLYICATALTAQNLTDPIKPDPNVKIGVLPNGITYYLRENKKPENRAVFRIAINAGSMQENDQQQGLAHFLEHMAFNGSKNFKGNNMVSELQKIGVTFGGDLNAYTSFDETVYRVQLPTDNPRFIDMGLTILHDWAAGLTLDGKEIDNERGIILEELRMGEGAEERMFRKWFPVLMKNSRYAERLPIGKKEVLENFKHETLRDFYKTWYRTDLMAIIVVGDFNAAEMEKKIIAKFSKIKPLKNPKPKQADGLTYNKEPLAVVCKEKEAMGNNVLILRKHPHFIKKTLNDLRTGFMISLYNMMYASRLYEMQQNPNTPFLSASTDYSNFLGDIDIYGSEATSKENKIEETVKTLMREDQRVLQHGFLQTELNRAKEEFLNNLETAANEVDKTESIRFSNEYSAHFTKNDPIPGIKRIYNYAKKYLEEITLEEINALAKRWITKENIVIVVTAPDEEGVNVPTEETILALINDPSIYNVEPYVDNFKDQNIFDEELTGCGIAQEKKIESIDAEEIILENGIRVILKQTDFKNDEILLRAYSSGGYSLYPEKDLASAMFATEFIERAGIGNFDVNGLTKKLKGKKVTITPYITATGEMIIGSSTPKDLDWLMQLTYAYFKALRKDSTVMDLIIPEIKEQIKQMAASPQYTFFSKFVGAASQYDPYTKTALNYTNEFVDEADYERGFQIFQERFCNGGNFTFVIVGNFKPDEMKTMVQKYLGSIPANTSRTNFNPNVFKPIAHVKTDVSFNKGEDKISWCGIAYKNNYSWNNKNNMCMNMISECLNIEVTEILREEMSGVYSPMAQMSYDKDPTPQYGAIILFSCDPKNADTLSDAVYRIMNRFTNSGPKQQTFAKAKETLVRQYETGIKTNGFWVSSIINKTKNNDSLDDIMTFKDRVNEITMQDLIDAMKTYFELNNYTRVVMYPEGYQK